MSDNQTDKFIDLILDTNSYVDDDLLDELKFYFNIPAGYASKIKGYLDLKDYLNRMCKVNENNVKMMTEALLEFDQIKLYEIWVKYAQEFGLDYAKIEQQ